MKSKNIIRTVQENVQDIICEGAGTLRGIQYYAYNGSFYVVDKGRERVLKYSSNGELQKTSQKRFNEPYGILVHQDYVLVCSSKDYCVCVLDLELNFCFDILELGQPMDITYFNHLFFVTTRKENCGEIVILDIDFGNEMGTPTFITNADNTKFGERIRGICASDKYLYVTERGHRNKKKDGGRILCLKYENMPSHKLKCVSEFKTPNNKHLPVDIACDENDIIYYSVEDEVNYQYSVAKLVHNPRGIMSGNKVIYPQFLTVVIQ